MHMDVLVPRSTWMCASGLARESGGNGAHGAPYSLFFLTTTPRALNTSGAAMTIMAMRDT